MKPAVSILALLFLGLLGCKKLVETSNVSPEIATEINRIQVENSLSDDEISAALERWVKMYSGGKRPLESEDILGGGAWTPERFAEVMAESERAAANATTPPSLPREQPNPLPLWFRGQQLDEQTRAHQ